MGEVGCSTSSNSSSGRSGAADVKVSPAEAIDAARTISLVGYADRELFKDALCADAGQDPRRGRPLRRDLRDLLRPRRAAPAPAAARRRASGRRERRAFAGGGGRRPVAARPDAAAGRRHGRRPGHGGRRRARGGRGDPPFHPAQPPDPQAAGRDGPGPDRADHRQTPAACPTARAWPTASTPPAAPSPPQAQRYVERQHELYAAGSGKALREEMLAKKALNADGGIDPRRPRHDAGPGAQDGQAAGRPLFAPPPQGEQGPPGRPARPCAAGVAYGGVPFQIAWKIKKVDKPSIVAICDVSKSVAAAAQFLLTFLYSLNDVVDPPGRLRLLRSADPGERHPRRQRGRGRDPEGAAGPSASSRPTTARRWRTSSRTTSTRSTATRR